MFKLFLFALTALLFIGCETDAKASANEDSDAINTKTNETEVASEANQTTIEAIEITSLDGLMISGEIYKKDVSLPWILLCHQATYNLHEYDEIAPKLNEMGFNCLAIDQRSGGELNGFSNQTNQRAQKQNLPTEYIDAEQDIIATINFMANTYKQAIILWGSSYSSALALHIATENENIKAVISFSPGDYFGSEKPPLKTVIPNLALPFFITSSNAEAGPLRRILNATILDNQHVQFIPNTEGKHGSKALWENHDGNAAYWNAIKTFLKEL